MIPQSFIPTMRQLKLNRTYVIYSGLYGLTTLIVPLAVQFLVNNLALSGIWMNIVGFMVIILIGLILSLILRYCQIILNEFLERELFFEQVKLWDKEIEPNRRKYFMEIFFSMKSFSKSFTTVVEMALVTIFGLLMVLLFHPVFIVLPILIGITLYQIIKSNRPAIESSIELSDEKYSLFDNAQENKTFKDQGMEAYLRARSERFSFIKRHSIKLMLLYVICQIALLGGGTVLVQSDQLSVGQLVSAEIIFSNIMISLNKMPDTLEGIYDFETSFYKLAKARGELDG
jgi:putative ABC transport system ATP-binding protein